jgi:hypothetical protein
LIVSIFIRHGRARYACTRHPEERDREAVEPRRMTATTEQARHPSRLTRLRSFAPQDDA